MAKSHEFSGALPPGPTGVLTALLEPHLLWPITWSTQLMQCMTIQNLTRKPDHLHASVVLENFHRVGPVPLLSLENSYHLAVCSS